MAAEPKNEAVVPVYQYNCEAVALYTSETGDSNSEVPKCLQKYLQTQPIMILCVLIHQLDLTQLNWTLLQFDQLLRSLWDQAMASGSVFRYPLTGVSTRRVPGKYGFVVQVTVWPDSHNHEPAVITAVWLGFTLTKMVVSFYLQSNTKRNTHRRTPIVINAVKQPFDPSKFNFNKINKQEVLLIRIIVTWLYVYILCGFVTDQWLFTFIISIRGVLLF